MADHTCWYCRGDCDCMLGDDDCAGCECCRGDCDDDCDDDCCEREPADALSSPSPEPDTHG